MPAEQSYGPTRPGTVLLDLGGNVGALVLSVPAALAGAEIEIGLADQPDGPRTHARVRRGIPGPHVGHVHDLAGPRDAARYRRGNGRAGRHVHLAVTRTRPKAPRWSPIAGIVFSR
jgi:hypothetical protein